MFIVREDYTNECDRRKLLHITIYEDLSTIPKANVWIAAFAWQTCMVAEVRKIGSFLAHLIRDSQVKF